MASFCSHCLLNQCEYNSFAVPVTVHLAEACRQVEALTLNKRSGYGSGMTWGSFPVPWHQSELIFIPQMWQLKSWWVLPSSGPSLGLSSVAPSCYIMAGAWQLDLTVSSSLWGHLSWPSLPACCKALLGNIPRKHFSDCLSNLSSSSEFVSPKQEKAKPLENV